MAYNPGVPIGSIIAYGGVKETVPPGWLYCDGSSYKIGNYFDLFVVINHYYGNHNLIDLSTPLAIQTVKANPFIMNSHFNLPDMRSRVIVGYERGKKYPSTMNDLTSTEDLTYTSQIGIYRGSDGFITETGTYSGPRSIPSITTSFIIRAL